MQGKRNEILLSFRQDYYSSQGIEQSEKSNLQRARKPYRPNEGSKRIPTEKHVSDSAESTVYINLAKVI